MINNLWGNLFEPQRQKTYLLTCAHSEDKPAHLPSLSVCTSAHSDQRLRFPHEETVSLVIQNAPSEDSSQNAWMGACV